jgi:hypothetical protein
MSSSGSSVPAGLDERSFDLLQRLEGRHRRIQSEHEVARRSLERLELGATDELRGAWRKYCEVTAELDHVSAEITALYTRSP